MSWCDCDPSLEDILSDPIVTAVMEADRVDPHALETMLSEIAQGLPAREGDGAAEERPHVFRARCSA